MEVKNFLNKHKVLISVILGLIVIFYLAFLFVVPNVINLNNYKKISKSWCLTQQCSILILIT